MIRQASLIEFHRWLGYDHHYFGKGYPKMIRRLKKYTEYLFILKQQEKEYYEKMFWLEIHGEIN